jgi:hypothetical protein
MMFRVSEIIYRLYRADIEKIPAYILNPKRARGTRLHDECRAWFLENIGDTIHLRLLSQGLHSRKHKGIPRVEERMTKVIDLFEISGQPDLWYDNMLIDYKFVDDLKNHVALQLVAYRLLVKLTHGIELNTLYAFHFFKDSWLSIQQVRPEYIDRLEEFFLWLVANHIEITDGGYALEMAFDMWQDIESLGLWQEVDVVFPPLTIANKANAIDVGRTLIRFKHIQKQIDFFRSELKRYMIENGIKDQIETDDCIFKLQESNRPTYKIPKEVKEKYKTGTQKSVSLITREK